VRIQRNRQQSSACELVRMPSAPTDLDRARQTLPLDLAGLLVLHAVSQRCREGARARRQREDAETIATDAAVLGRYHGTHDWNVVDACTMPATRAAIRPTNQSINQLTSQSMSAARCQVVVAQHRSPWFRSRLEQLELVAQLSLVEPTPTHGRRQSHPSSTGEASPLWVPAAY